jgi:hypothetical protein
VLDRRQRGMRGRSRKHGGKNSGNPCQTTHGADPRRAFEVEVTLM